MKTLSLTLTSLLLAGGMFAADPTTPEPPKKSDAELIYEKLLADNTKQADAAYLAYLKGMIRHTYEQVANRV